MRIMFILAGAAMIAACAWATTLPLDARQETAGAAADDPGPRHERLVGLAGSWTTSSTVRMGGAAGEPQGPAEEGTARVEAIMGGRFIALHESGVMMGEATETLKIFGYNSSAEVYEASWIYDGSTAIMRLRGTSDNEGRVVSFQGQYAVDTQTSQRFIITMAMLGDDRFMISLAALLPDGTTGPTLETMYTRSR